MKVIKPKYPLYLKKTKERGWGVYCSKFIPKGRVFETAPIIFLPAKVWKRTSDTPIESYRFSFWGDSCAIVLGFGSLYNHSKEGENASYNLNRKSRTYSFYATKDIPANTEIFHDYNWDESEYTKRGMKSPKKPDEAKAAKKKPKSSRKPLKKKAKKSNRKLPAKKKTAKRRK